MQFLRDAAAFRECRQVLVVIGNTVQLDVVERKRANQRDPGRSRWTMWGREGRKGS